MQCDALRAKLAEAEKATAALQVERRKQQSDLEFQDAEMTSLKQTVAQQVDELVRPGGWALAHPRQQELRAACVCPDCFHRHDRGT